IPLTLKAKEGLFLPPLFAIGTGIPVIICSFVIAVSLQKINKFFAFAQKTEKIIRYIVASVFLISGIYYLQFLIKYLFL
ncbi:MAG: sulfite exporter TauE/SafE family protein, partial [Candidatus Staskawiczbacteria bacterium]|nr:sulfite exporter TauE/SafE family protein [Candidatus Staskawiczbacteria bacterium]